MNQSTSSVTNTTLRLKTREIEQILSLCKEGKSIIEIASALSLAQSYVQYVLLCAQTLAEEDAVAIAMLMEDA